MENLIEVKRLRFEDVTIRVFDFQGTRAVPVVDLAKALGYKNRDLRLPDELERAEFSVALPAGSWITARGRPITRLLSAAGCEMLVLYRGHRAAYSFWIWAKRFLMPLLKRRAVAKVGVETESFLFDV